VSKPAGNPRLVLRALAKRRRPRNKSGGDRDRDPAPGLICIKDGSDRPLHCFLRLARRKFESAARTGQTHDADFGAC
jgi:hypothetical protein